MSSMDFLRDFTAPRALLVGLVFAVAIVLRAPAVLLAVLAHVLDRAADRLLAWADRVPPARVPVVSRAGR